MSVSSNGGRANPLEVVERMAIEHNWAVARLTEAEVALAVNGAWASYQVSFDWMEETELLHLACAFEIKVPPLRLSEVQRLIVSINEQLWIGHFDVWTDNGMITYRHALLLAGGLAVSGRQCEVALGSALDACERYYPTFQSVIWGGRTAREALDAVMFETRGVA